MVAGNVISWFRKASTCTNGATLGTMSCSSYMVTQAGCACARRAGAVHAANAAATAAALVRNSRRPFWLIAFPPKNFSLVTLIWRLPVRLYCLHVSVKKRRLRKSPARVRAYLLDAHRPPQHMTGDHVLSRPNAGGCLRMSWHADALNNCTGNPRPN